MAYSELSFWYFTDRNPLEFIAKSLKGSGVHAMRPWISNVMAQTHWTGLGTGQGQGWTL